jgi:hypothetical protein
MRFIGSYGRSDLSFGSFFASAALAALAGCGPQAPVKPPSQSQCVKTITADVEVPTQRAADILIVVDNSGSMLEEQQNLGENFLNQNPAQCPLQDLNNIPEAFRNPAPELYEEGGPLALCGFIQLVAAFENDFRVGVITTDVGLCDNRLPEAQGGDEWGFRPQRGCLQPDSAPGGTLRKVIARADLTDDDPNNDDLAARFGSTLDNIRTFGSPLERGLDAMAFFLDPRSSRSPSCEDDLSLFRRADASLVVIFLSDEEDCSHGLGGKLETFGNENEDEVCGAFRDHFLLVPSSRCYDRVQDLSPIELYADALLSSDPGAKVAVIAGGIGAAGNITPAGCLVGNDGAPEGGADVCFSSGGLSNLDRPGEPCGPDNAEARGGLPCCVADAGSRYYAFADFIGRQATDSICNRSFRGTMLDIAAFAASTDFVFLAEPPDSPDAMIVEITRAGAEEGEVLPRLGDDADCSNEDGFRLQNENTVQLCGAGRLGPGDVVRVLARAPNAGEGEGTCRPTNLQASGGGVHCQSAAPGGLAFAGALLAGALAFARSRRFGRMVTTR